VAFHSQEKKVVAVTGHPASGADRVALYCRRKLSFVTFYLYAVLISIMHREIRIEPVLLLVAVLIVLYGIFKKEVLLIMALLVGILSRLFPSIRDMISHLWMKLAESLAFLHSRLLLTLIFYFVLTPLALLYRLSGKDPMQRKKRPEASSYFIDRHHTYGQQDFLRTW
jgi:hypothetical protein